MKFLAVCVVAACIASDGAAAKTFERSVASGQKEKMHVYMSWKKCCIPNKAVIKVLAKPWHGTLTPNYVTATIAEPRRGRECIGTPMEGFQVTISRCRNSGTDSFKIQVTFGNRLPEIDTYTVNVK